MIKHFIFDFGNVLTKYDFLDYAEKISGSKEGAKIIVDNTFHSPDWKYYDAGLIEEDELIKRCQPYVPEKYREHLATVVKTFEQAFVQYDDMIPVLRALKAKGYTTYLLSNFPKGKFEQVADICPILDLIDNPVVSYKIKMKKPDAEIYNYLLDTYSVKADECLFADDSDYCIKGAEAVGIKAHLFTTAENYLKCLNELNVEL